MGLGLVQVVLAQGSIGGAGLSLTKPVGSLPHSKKLDQPPATD
jgi:hypothetical protein